MGMTITQMPCNPGNYTARRSSAIRYIVIHYTGAPGTAKNCGTYFGRDPDIGASAHYFVDEHDIVQSVPDAARAWHCGASAYKHTECRNDNSLGVELCCYPNGDGTWYFAPETVANAVQLVRSLMAKYSIDADHIVRHYDVTGKVCPEPYVRDAAAWAEFKARLTAPETEETVSKTYKNITDVPDYWRADVQELMNLGLINGGTPASVNDKDVNLSEDTIKALVIMKGYVDALLIGADTRPSGWAADELAEAVAAGITDGTRPRGYATREETAIMVHRAGAGK